MKKLLYFIAIVLLITILFCSCCSNSALGANDSMFIEIESDLFYKVVYHKDSKVMYVVSDGQNNRGNFTVMVDENNKPMLYKGDEQ